MTTSAAYFLGRQANVAGCQVDEHRFFDRLLGVLPLLTSLSPALHILLPQQCIISRSKMHIIAIAMHEALQGGELLWPIQSEAQPGHVKDNKN